MHGGPIIATIAVFILFAVMLALVVFPTGFFTWTVPLLAILAGLGLILCLYLTPRELRARLDSRRARGIEAAYLALLLFLLLSLVPLPLKLTRITGTERYNQNVRVVEALEQATEQHLLENSRASFSLTRNRAGTLRMTIMIVAMYAVAMLAAMLPSRWKMTYIRFLTCIGGAVAVGGLLSRYRYPQGDTLWWISPIRHGLPGPVACFTNQNHFGGFLAMLCPAQIGLMADDFVNRRILRGLAGGCVFALLSLGVLVSYSRGAFLTYLAAGGAVLLIFALRRRFVAAVTLGALGSALLMALLVHAAPQIKERLQSLREVTQEDSYITRVNAWRDSVRIFRTYPIAGAGVNAFRMVYPQHRRTSDGAFMSHAENEYVQLLTDTGIIGVALFLLLTVFFIRDAVIPAAAAGPALLVAGLGPILAAAANSLVDFPLHIPLYAIALASLAGLLLPFPCPPERGVRPGLSLPPVSAATAVSLAAVCCLVLVWGRRQNVDSRALIHDADLPTLQCGLVWAPTSSYAWRHLGRRAAGSSKDLEVKRFGERCVAQASAYDPNNYRLWNTLGETRLSVGDIAGAAQAFARVKELRDWFQVPFLPEDLERERAP